MLRKFILPLVLLIFTQNESYGMNGKTENKRLAYINPECQLSMWRNISLYINYDEKNKKEKPWPILWPLWAFLDNILFQYGNSKIWKYIEAYYGLSTGIGLFPSFLKFKWLKVGILDAHINIINAVINYIRLYVERMRWYYVEFVENNNILKDSSRLWLNIFSDCMHSSFVMTGIHLLSFKLFNCVKIKIISIVAIAKFYDNELSNTINHINKPASERRWYLIFYIRGWREELLFITSSLYLCLAPRIEINISRIIKYFI